MKKGFTLIELLAVIVILAIIALIATPIILNIIRDSKEKSALISVDNYLRSIENVITKETMKNPNTNYDGKYIIINGGKVISSTEKGDIAVEYNGEGLKSGTIFIGDGKVRQVENVKTKDNYHVLIILGEVKLFKQLKPAVLTTGQNFNTKIKSLVSGKEITSYYRQDLKVKEIEFLGYGILPRGYTLEEFQKLDRVDISVNQDETIYAIYDGIDKIYVYAEGEILFNESSSNMFYSFSSVKKINFGDFINTYQTTNMSSMFYGCENLIQLNLSKFNTSNVTNMYYLFWSCFDLEQLDLGLNFDTTKVTTMEAMFMNCKSLTTLDVSNFNTSNVTMMWYMFGGCKKLKIIDVSNFDTSQVKNMVGMFSGCSSLTELDLSNFSTGNVIQIEAMFSNCSNLITLDLSNFDTSKVSKLYANGTASMKSMFKNCTALTKLNISNFDTRNITEMQEMFYGTTNLKPIYVGEKWVINESTDVTNMFSESKTASVEELCEPNSTEEWCVITSI